MTGVQARVATAAKQRLGENRYRRLVTARRRLLCALAGGNLPRLAAICRTDKWGGHWYAKHYQRHLRHLRWKKVTVLEIGIGGFDHPRAGGQSLHMWKAFFPRGEIYGLDLYDKSQLAETRIHPRQGDQSNGEVLDRLLAETGPLDVVIDDGSHLNAHVRATFEYLFPRLPEGALYIIEDTQTSYWPEYGGSNDRNAQHTMMAMVKDIVDGLNYEEFHLGEEPSYTDLNVVAVHCYHNLVVFEKGRNTEGSIGRELQFEVLAPGT